ncbi:hypothetical protein [Arthrobacter sp. ISL-65]|uniref:hypothetical protein n=1 Tax=Arthrobacter sp. ISL-65 TaxID=2819112 RepID=UPI001BEBE9D1|nr:hypothetical protein [Arthrobacter sp. ISL-65]MBT2550424.1 hypothetical protein [Arthrobacter sp. ISL-65]
MTKTGNQDTEEPAEKATQTKKGLGLSLIQLIAGGGAAAVASVIGGHLGLAGTVVGAFILSVVSAIAVPLFHASLEKSHQQIKRVVPRRVTDAARTTRPQMAADTASIDRAASSKASATALPLEQPWEGMADAQHAPHKSSRGRKARMAIGGTATIFVIGVGSILGIQSATGVALSNGTSTLQESISQVVSYARDSTDTPATDPKPSAPAVEPSTVATDPATDPTEQPTVTPTLTSEPTPSAEPTAPAGADNPVPPSTPDPATGTSDGSSGADGADNHAQPSAETSAGGTPTK